MKRLLIYALLFILAFLVGFGPQYWKNYKLQKASVETIQEKDARIAALESQLQLRTLQGMLGMMIIDLHQGNYGNARGRAGGFFDGIRGLASKTGDEKLKQQLDNVMSKRDEIISGLTALNAGVTATLESMYVSLQDNAGGL